jgi:hypothetical protein
MARPLERPQTLACCRARCVAKGAECIPRQVSVPGAGFVSDGE